MNFHAQTQYKAAVSALKNGRIDEAAKILEELLDSGSSEVAGLLGTIRMEQGRLDEAGRLFNEVLKVAPENTAALYNLARTLQMEGEYLEAQKLYERLVGLNPAFFHAWNNLGLIYKETGRLEKAEHALRRVVEVAPRHASGFNNLAVVLESLGRLDEACSMFRRALELDKNYFSARFNLGCLLFRLGRYEEAEKELRFVLSIKKDEPTARFLLQSMGCMEPPDRAPTQYVKKTFDDWAGEFEKRLVKDLHYKTPQKLYTFLSPFLKPGISILDLGCGTGLGAHLYRPFASFLAGMDCSRKMLERAERKRLYDALYEHDILEPWPTGRRFNLIYSSDCLCYFGELKALFKIVGEHLPAGGIFGFSVEMIQEGYDSNEGFRLGKSGRYCHKKTYVAATLKKSGFEPIMDKEVILRKEGGQEVRGLLFAAKKESP